MTTTPEMLGRRYKYVLIYIAIVATVELVIALFK